MKAEDINSYGDYREYVEELADMTIEEWDRNDDGDPEDPHYDIGMNVDQCRAHMMYSNNLSVLEHSDSEPEEWQIYVDDDETNHRKVIQAMAYAVLRYDVTQEIQDRDGDYLN